MNATRCRTAFGRLRASTCGKRLRTQFVVFAAMLVLSLIPTGSPAAQAQTNSRTFDETGKTISGPFLDYWDAHGGLAQQGYPISDELQETSPVDGKPYKVQYFERAEFEYHPENAQPFNVLAALLGDLAYTQMYPQGAPGQKPNTDDGSLLFEQTSKRLGGKFLAYWQAHGAEVQQGYPISDEFQEVSPLDGKPYLVQYFERAEFEYHPENDPPYDVLLAQLGTFSYLARHLAAPLPTPTPSPPLPPTAQPSQTPVVTGTGSDWPMYGQNAGRTDYSAGETIIGASNVAELAPRWQAPLGTNGNPSSSSPVVANGRVYVGSSAPTGPNFYAFDAATGAAAWSANVGYFQSCDGVGIGSTAAISGTVLAVGGGDRAYYGLNALTGAQLWRDDIDAGQSAFAWESPLLAYGLAYIGVASDCDNPSVRGQVRAVDMITGAQVANQYFVPDGKAGAGVWNSPSLSPDATHLVVATGEDFAEYDGPYNRALLSLDPRNLQIMQANKQGQVNSDSDFATSPIVFDHGGRTLVFVGHKDSDFYLYDLANIAAGPIWHRTAGLQVGMLPAYTPDNDGTILFAAHGNLFGVDPDTGTDRWPPLAIGAVHGNMAVANGLVYLNGGSAGLKVVDATSGELVRTLVPPDAGPTFSGVAVAHGIVYWVAGAKLNAWSLPGR